MPATPTVALVTENTGASSTSHTITFTQTTGDRVIIFFGLNDTAQSLATVGDSFVNLTNTNATFHILTKVLDGSEGGNMVITVGSASKSAWLAYNIQGHDSATAPVFSTVTTGTSTAPNSGSLSPTGGSKKYLWISAFRQNGEEADDDTWCSAAPSTPGTFTGLVQKTTGTSGATTVNGSVAAAQYAAETATVDPGAFTVAQSLAWRAYTVAVYPGAAANTGTAGDSVASLSDATGRTGVFARANGDSMAGSTYSATVLADNPVSYWRLGEPSGATAVDVMGVNDGTYQGTVTKGVAGALTGDSDTAVTFPGTDAGNDDAVQVATPTGLPSGSAVRTVEAWFKTSSTQDYMQILGYGSMTSPATNGMFEVYVTTTSADQIYFATNSQDINFGGGGFTVANGAWHHLVLVLETTTSLRCYVDGTDSLGSTNPVTITALDTGLNTTGLLIGAQSRYGLGSWGATFDGSIDEVAVYSTALSAARVQAHYTAGTTAAGGISESIAKVRSLPRTIAEATLGAISDAVVASKAGVQHAVATAADAISSVSTTLARAFVGTRQAGDTFSGTLSEAISRRFTGARSAADTFSGTLSEAVARSFGGVRSAADTFAGVLSEAIARRFTGARTTAETFGGVLSETVGRAFVGVRAAGDTFGGVLSETVSKLQSKGRSAADSIASLTEAATRQGVFVRSATEAALTASEAVARAAAAKVRTATEAALTASEAVARAAAAKTRTAADTFGGTLSETVARVGVLARSAADTFAGALGEVVGAVKGGPGAFTASAVDVISSLSDAIGRRGVFGRTATDATGAISEAVTRVGVFVRSGAASVATLTESVARAAAAKTRTIAGEAVATLTEAVTRTGVFTRAGSAAIGSLTEAVTQAAVFVRSGTDALAAISEAVTRRFTGGRASADSVGSLSESVSRRGVFARTASAAVSAISEAVEAIRSGASAYVRTAADAVASASEAASRAFTGGRSASDAVGSLSSSVTRALSAVRAAASDLPSLSDAMGRQGVFGRLIDDATGAITDLVDAVKEGPSSLVRYVVESIASLVESVGWPTNVGGHGPRGTADHAHPPAGAEHPEPVASAQHPKPREQ